MDSRNKKQHNNPKKQRQAKKRNEFLRHAAEFAVNSGSEVAILISSKDHGIVHSYGHPNVDKVLDRFLQVTDCSNNTTTSADPAVLEHNNKKKLVVANDQNVEVECMKMLKQLVAAMSIDRNMKAIDNGRFWWDKPTDEMKLEEVALYKEAAEVLKTMMEQKIKERC